MTLSKLRRAATTAVAVGALASLGLAGCGGGGSTSNDGGSATQGNVTWWSWNAASRPAH
jgi:hypothetical protein